MNETIEGTVTKYKGNGRKLGYPTANLSVSTELDDGVYFGLADLADYSAHPAIIFIGTPVTVGDTLRRIEAHLLGAADTNYYDLPLRLTVCVFHRTNKHFNSVDELVLAMKDDEKSAYKWFKEK